MFCIKCGEDLREHPDGFLMCRRDLEYSIDFSDWLRQNCPPSLPRQSPPLSGSPVPGAWWCPGCARQLLGTDTVCASCGVDLRGKLRVIVECHPHPDGRGGYF